MSQFVQVVDDDGDEPIELPTEPNSDLLLSTVVAQFPGVCGLKYKTAESKSTRGVRLVEGRLIAPDEGWASYIFLTVYPKVGLEAQKRKGDPLDYPGSKSKKLDKMRCSDLIVLGLPWKSTEDDIRKYFSTYGELTMVQLKVDHKTKQSKGFGFIRFADYESQLKALSQKHLIDGRWCNLRIPNSKEWAVSLHEGSVHPELSNKIYVGRLTEDMTSEDLHEYFSQFGEVREVFIPKPFRAFAFVSFADPFIAQSLYGDDHVIKNVSVHIGTATPKNSERYMNDGYGSWQGKEWTKAGSSGAMIEANAAAAAVAASMGLGGNSANSNFSVSPAIIAAAAQAAIAQGLLGMMGQGGSYAGGSGDSAKGYTQSGYGSATGGSVGKSDVTQAGSYSAYGAYQGGSWSGV